MPNFETVPLEEAMIKTATGKRAQIIKEYVDYIEQLKGGRAGRLRASVGESVGAVRRRLGAAAKVTGKGLTIKRIGDDVYFWLKSRAQAARRRGGRPRGSTTRGQ